MRIARHIAAMTVALAAVIAVVSTNASAQGDDPHNPKAVKGKVVGPTIKLGETLSLPSGTAVFGKREFAVRPKRLTPLTWDEAKDTTLFYTWDGGATWTKLNEAIYQQGSGSSVMYLFPMAVDRDGLIGFYEVCPRLKDTDPKPGESPRQHIYIDTVAPQARGIAAERSGSKVNVSWAFDEPLPVRDGKAVTIKVNGQEVASGQPTNGSAELNSVNGPMMIELTCRDQAGNISEVLQANLPGAKLD
mgnify:CR=1 FL=1